MVNTGKPSKGCARCKKRKVACDLTLPGCIRCARLGHECPGYPNRGAATVTFKDATDATRRRARRIYDRLEQQQEASSSTLDSRAVATAHPERADISLDLQSLSSLKDFIITGAVCTFAGQWSEDDVLLFDGNFQLAASMYPECSPCLQAAVETYALWAMAIDKTGSTVALRTPMLQMYGRTLQMINRSLARPSAADVDHVLLAIELIGIFEIIALKKPIDDPYVRTRVHLLGLLGIIGHRGPQQFASEISRRLFLDTFTLFMMGSIPLPDVVPLPIPQNACKMLLGTPATARELVDYNMLPLLQRTLELRISFQTLLRQDPENLHTLLTEALSLGNDLDGWYKSLPPEYSESHALGRDNMINMWRVHQIVVQDVLVHCYYSMEKVTGQPKCFDPQVNECKAKAEENIDAILHSTPYSPPTEGSTSNPRSKATSARMVLHHMTFSHPLLICSMVKNLSSKQRSDIDHARLANAASFGLDAPIRTFEAIYLPRREQTSI